MKPVEQYETGQSFAGPERNWPDEKWWTAYHDPQLDKLIEEALVQAPSMTIAEARFKQAVAIAKQVGAVLQPQVSMDASATVQKLSYNYNLPPDLTPRGTHGYGSMALNFNWELDFWGKNRAALQAATSAREAAAADAAQARLLLSASIASEYGELTRLYDTLDTVNAIAGIQKKIWNCSWNATGTVWKTSPASNVPNRFWHVPKKNPSRWTNKSDCNATNWPRSWAQALTGACPSHDRNCT